MPDPIGPLAGPFTFVPSAGTTVTETQAADGSYVITIGVDIAVLKDLLGLNPPQPPNATSFLADTLVVRLNQPGYLALAEVQAFDLGGSDVAMHGLAGASSVYTSSNAPIVAIDGNTGGNYYKDNVFHSAYEASPPPEWKVVWTSPQTIQRIVIWNRTDGGPAITGRLNNFTVALLLNGAVVWSTVVNTVPNPSATVLGG